MRYSQLPSNLFIKNRKKVLAKLPSNSMAVVFSNPQMPKNGDEFYPFRQNSDLFYLTGIDQEKTIVILTNINGYNHEILFVLDPKPTLEQWQGRKLRKEEATNISGVQDVRYTDTFDEVWKELAQVSEHIFYSMNCNPRLEMEIAMPDELFGEKIKRDWKGKDIQCLAEIISSCRLIKEPEEIACIQRASDITGEAFREIVMHTKPDMYEYELEAIMTHCFIRNGTNGHAFDPIIANGRNTCYLHYNKNDQKLEDGALVLMDFGSDYANYASDCTRVFPVNGRFTVRQKQYYQAVLSVFKEMKATFRPGITIEDCQKKTCELIQNQLFELGLLSKEEYMDTKAYFKYYMHGVSHFIGLDTHDVGDKKVILQAGMVISCEPGIYCFEENTGIRLENTLLITENGCRDFMENIPLEIEEIEAMMR